MEISIYNIRATAGGAEAEISVEISASADAVQRLKGTISAEMLAELGLPSMLTSPILIDQARCDELMFCMQKTAAIKKGMSLLDYAQNTKKGLCDKLRRKGYSTEVAEAAADYLAEHGFINEQREAEFLVQTMAGRKLYGKNRIKRELFAKGFEQDVIRSAVENTEIDFGEVCIKRIRSLGGEELFESREKKAKTVAALMRYGFCYDDIKEALNRIREE